MTQRPSRSILSVVVAGTLFLTSPSALAQAEPAPADASQAANDQKARDLFTKGAKARDEGNLKGARQSFLEAWALKKHEQIAATLGLVEYELKDYAGAAEHLEYFLKNAPSSTPPADRARVQKMFDESRAKVGLLNIEVHEKGAEVWVGTRMVGISPLQGAVYAEGGTRTVEARLDGYTSSPVEVEVKAGAQKAETVRLDLVKTSAQGGDGKPKRDEDDGKPEKALIYVGLGLTGAGLVTTAVSTVFSIMHSSDAAQRRENNCDSYEMDRGACEQDYDKVRKKWALSTNVAINAGILTGIAGLGTLAYVYWPWRKKASSDPEGSKPISLDIQVGQKSGSATATMRW